MTDREKQIENKGVRIHIPEFIPMAKCNEHLAHPAFDITLTEEELLQLGYRKVVFCKDCENCIEDKKYYYKDIKMHCCSLGYACFSYELGFCSDGIRKGDSE